MAKINKFEVGRHYVVKLTDERNCEVIREYSKLEFFLSSFPRYLAPVLKVLALMVSIVFPPLLLITVPLLRKTNG